MAKEARAHRARWVADLAGSAPVGDRSHASVENRSARLRDWVELLLCLGVISFLRFLPASWSFRLGSALGTIAFALLPQARKAGLKNLAIAFPSWPESERRRVLRESFRNLGRMVAELSRIDRVGVEELRRRVKIADPELWQRLLTERKGQGLLVLTAHFGNWELLAWFHGRLGYPVTLIHRPLRNPLLDTSLLRWRAKAGTRSIPKRRAAREALRALREGAVLAIPADQNQVFSFGVFVDFFGLPACTTTGPVRIAQHAGVPVVPVFLRRCGASQQHVLEVYPPIAWQLSTDHDADLIENTRRCSAVIEDIIRQYPEQWIWFHKRWKTRPPGEPRIYD